MSCATRNRWMVKTTVDAVSVQVPNERDIQDKVGYGLTYEPKMIGPRCTSSEMNDRRMKGGKETNILPLLILTYVDKTGAAQGRDAKMDFLCAPKSCSILLKIS